MPKKLDICLVGHPCMNKYAQPVNDPKSTEIQELIGDMFETCRAESAVGLAAPQVGHSLRIIIIASAPNSVYPGAPRIKPFAMINPRITDTSDERFPGYEGCLSVPWLRGRVDRHFSLNVVYTTPEGQKKSEFFEGFPARIVQHEIDHLDGKTFLDHCSDLDLVTIRQFQKMQELGAAP